MSIQIVDLFQRVDCKTLARYQHPNLSALKIEINWLMSGGGGGGAKWRLEN